MNEQPQPHPPVSASSASFTYPVLVPTKVPWRYRIPTRVYDLGIAVVAFLGGTAVGILIH